MFDDYNDFLDKLFIRGLAILFMALIASLSASSWSVLIIISVGVISFIIYSRERPRRTYIDLPLQKKPLREPHLHTTRALENAGRTPYFLDARPVDIGVLAFWRQDQPTLHRTTPVPNDSEYIQPFVELRTKEKTDRWVKFELLDGHDQLTFTHEMSFSLNSGDNLIMPPARHAVQDQSELEENWTLKIYINGELLASHPISWRIAEYLEYDKIDRFTDTDGEITPEMQVMLKTMRVETVSIDDLLEGDEGKKNQ